MAVVNDKDGSKYLGRSVRRGLEGTGTDPHLQPDRAEVVGYS